MNRKSIGKQFENKAAQYLESQGYSILARNYQNRYGEIDLIVTKDRVLVFVEVKGQQAPVVGDMGETVNFRKQKQIIRTAQGYLNETRVIYPEIRFDVITLVFYPHKNPEITHIPSAFESLDSW